MTPTSPAPRHATWPVVLAVLAVALGVGLVTAAADHGDPVPFRWPAAGVGAGAVAIACRRRWAPLAVAAGMLATLAAAVHGHDLLASTVLGLACAAEALVVAAVLGWGRHRAPRLVTQDDFLRVLAAAAAGGVTAAVVITAGLRLLLGSAVPPTFAAAFGAHASAILLVVPAALTLLGRHRPGRRWELAAQTAATALATAAVFWPRQELGLTWIVLPFLVWGALRFDVRTTAFQLAGFAAVTTYLTTVGNGPFADALADGDVGLNAMHGMRQAYLLCAVLLTLPLAIAVQQRARLLRRVSEDERLFRRNFTASLVGMAILRQDGDRLLVVDINDTAAGVLDGTRDDLVGRSLDTLLVTDGGLPTVVASARAAEADGWRGHATVPGRPGSRVDVAVSLLSDDDDDLVWSAQLLDVTAEHEARRRSEAAEQLTSATLDTTACIVLVTDLDGRVVRVNAATTAITGYAADELLDRPLWETPLDSAAAADDPDSSVHWPHRSVVPQSWEGDLLTQGGERLRVVWSDSVVHDDDGEPTYTVLTGIDVTVERTTAGLLDHLMRATSTTALVGIDTVGRIDVFNSGAQSMLGYDRHEVLGLPFTSLLDPAELLERTGAESPQQAFALLVEGICADGESPARDWTWVTRTGRRCTVSMTLSVAHDAFASQVGFLCVGRDVTEQHAGQEMLVAALEKERTAVERLRMLDAAKDEFVSTVSHELRTPVTSIAGYTEMLTDGSLVEPLPAQVPLLRTIARNSQRLIVVCNDLLLLSGLDSGSIEWKRDPVDLTRLLGPAEEAVRPLLTGRRLHVDFGVPPEPVVVAGDRAQLDRVLLNLLSNAVKFTEDGGSVACRLATSGDEAVLTVSDTGIGIPVEEQGGLFQKFFRSSTAQKRAIQGTGLGLSIVAGVVEGHGGRVEVESADRQGTTFTVRLPLAS